MNNEAIMDQIVRSLSFEVVAVPQNVVHINSTSKSTPLNVKIRVRKKHTAELRHGVLSMPKVDTRSESRKSETPERIRLVSSDQTIMNFDVLMEADFDKRHHQENVQEISPGFDVNNVDLNVPNNTNDFQTAQIFSKRNKDIFGRCKPDKSAQHELMSFMPRNNHSEQVSQLVEYQMLTQYEFHFDCVGSSKEFHDNYRGCLDPPFGEDKYSYQPTLQTLPPAVKDDTAKLKSSSIFKNNIFKRKKSKYKSDDEHNKLQTNIKNEVDSVTNLTEKGSLKPCSPYTSAIITYPDTSNYPELRKKGEKKINREEEQSYKKIRSSDERSKTSILEDGSYFMIPKKTRNLSHQSNLNTMQKYYTKTSDETNLENKNILRTAVNSENLEDNKTPESKFTSQAHTFIPIPLVGPLKATIFSPKTNTMLKSNSEVKNTSTQLLSNASQEKIGTKIQDEIIKTPDKDNLIKNEKNLTLPELKTLTNSDPNISAENEISISKKGNRAQILNSIIPQETSPNSFVNDRKERDNISQILEPDIFEQESEHNELDVSQNMPLKLEKNLNESNEDNAQNKKNNLENERNLKSHPLLADAREKSILGITIDLTDQIKENSTKNAIDISKFSESQDDPYSSQDLYQIWENEQEDLKSKADVITTKTMLPMNYHEMNLNGDDKTIETVMNGKEDENSQLDKIAEKLTDNHYDPLLDCVRLKEQPIIHETISGAKFQSDSVTPSKTIKNGAQDITKEKLYSISEKNVINVKLETIDTFLPKKHLESKDYLLNYESGTHMYKNRKGNISQGEIFENSKKVLLPENNIENINSVETLKLTDRNESEYKYNHINNDHIKVDSSHDTVKRIDNDESSNQINSDSKIDKTINLNNYNNLDHTGDFNNDKQEDIFTTIQETSIKSFSREDNINDKGPLSYKSKHNASNQSIMRSESLTYKEVETLDKQDKKNFGSDLEMTVDTQNRDEALILFDSTFAEREKPELETQLENINDADEINSELDKISLNNLPEVLYQGSDASQPPLTSRTSVVPWKMDIALQSYMDENNEKIIKSFDSKHVPERRLNDAFLVARCYLGEEFNEIKIPIDQDNDLSVKVVNTKPQHRNLVKINEHANSTNQLLEKKKIKVDVSDKSQYQRQADINDSNVSDEYRKKRLKINSPVSDSDIAENYTDYEHLNTEAKKSNQAIIGRDIRDALNSIYEDELIPLQGMIKGLKEDIDALVAYQKKIKVQNLTFQRSKLLRHPHKKCYCLRRL